MRFVLLAAGLCLAAPAIAESVMVKYRGPVDLTGFDCKAQPSSLVWRTCYQPRTQYLVVNLKGTYYHYCRMPPSVVAAWRQSDSLGRFYLSEVKGRFDCRAGGVPD